jgi:hypothetical protein
MEKIKFITVMALTAPKYDINLRSYSIIASSHYITDESELKFKSGELMGRLKKVYDRKLNIYFIMSHEEN